MNAKVLFYVFVSIFVATAVITLMGVAGSKYVTIPPTYRDKLFYSLILEVVGGIVALFKSQFSQAHEKVKLRFDIKEIYDINAIDTFKCNIKLRNSVDGKETILPCNLYHDDFGLCSDVDIANYKQTLFVTVEIGNDKYHGSEWLETRDIILKKI
jgi:hypothetical protein